MQRVVELTEHTCDGCGKQWHCDEYDDIPLGFHGSVVWHHGAGGHGADWFGCSEKCIRKAVVGALEAER